MDRVNVGVLRRASAVLVGVAMVVAGTATRSSAAVHPSITPTGNGTTYESPNWVDPNPSTTPTGNEVGSASAYDPARQQTVLLENCQVGSSNNYTACTWTWNGKTWTEAANTSGSMPDSDEAVAWDPQLQEVISFGGDPAPSGNDSGQSSTWAWNGTAWTQLSTVGAPPDRQDATMVWDAALSEMVLFGGVSFQSGYFIAYGDTWTFSNNTWTQLSPSTSPPARTDAMMAYLPGPQQLVMFSGYGNGSGYALDDTWVLSASSQWSQVSTPTAPTARNLGAMTYDPSLGAAVLFGGEDDTTGDTDGDTWAWTGSQWLQANGISSPSPRFLISLAQDVNGALVLTGANGSDDTSLYSSDVPRLRVSATSPAGSQQTTSGQPITVDVVATNTGAEPIPATSLVTALGPSLHLTGTQAGTWVGPSSAIGNLPGPSARFTPCTASSTPACTATSAITEQVTGLTIPAGDSVIQQFSAAATNVSGCTTDDVTSTATNVYGSSVPSTAPFTVCQPGRGIRTGWRYR